MAFTWPVKAPVSQNFASNPSSIQPNGHTGIDFAVAAGTPLRATGAGKVVFEGWATTLSANNPWWIAPAYAGICVVIDHGNGLLSLYGHLSATHINTGDWVEQGQVFALSGNTGLSTGPHLHFELLTWPLQAYNGFYGRVNPSNYVSGNFQEDTGSGGITKPNQRKVGPANVNQRAQANPNSEIVRIIAANTVEEFTGFIRGADVEGNNIWFADAQGYAWSGGFVSQATDSLVDLTPKPRPEPKPNERYCGKDNANQRSAPNTSGAVVRVIAAGSLEIFDGFVRGENIEGNDIWYKDVHGYTWSGGFENPTANGLPDLTPKIVLPNERVVGGAQLNQRKLPNTSSEVIRVVEAGAKEIFTHYTIGQKIEENDLWYKDADGYIWSGGFTEQKIDGLERFDIPVVPIPDPDPVTPIEVDGIHGIDISNHQKGIDLNKIDADFILIKSSEGINWTDPEFATNVAKARATGLLVGFYHFARPVAGNAADVEARSFLEIVKPHLRVGDVLVLDWEAENQQNTAWAKEWLDVVATATNSSPLIYMNLSTANAHDWSQVKPKYKLWLAQYPSSKEQGYGPIIPEHGKVPGWSVAMWQYTSTGRLANWGGNLDLNVFYGTADDWDVLGVKDTNVPIPPIDPVDPVDPVKPPIDPVDPPVDPPVVNEKAILMGLFEKLVDDYLASKKQ